jgi:hypothetical protein
MGARTFRESRVMSGTEYTTTPNLGLYKPTYNADAENWGTHLNANSDVLDTAILPRPGGATGPTWTAGTGAPTTTEPLGSLYSRTDGAVGSTIYVSRGAGTWNPVAGV